MSPSIAIAVSSFPVFRVQRHSQQATDREVLAAPSATQGLIYAQSTLLQHEFNPYGHYSHQQPKQTVLFLPQLTNLTARGWLTPLFVVYCGQFQ
jgi:hypothetical protein